MGVCLPKAVESTLIERVVAKAFRVGVAEMSGWRSNMEDAHLIYTQQDWGFFGVFDGHGGDQCSKFVAPRIRQALEAEGCPADDEAVKELMLRVDQEFLDTDTPSGSTGTMVIVRPPTVAGSKYGLRVVNIGDSRVLLGRMNGEIVSGGEHCTDQGLTVDHKPCHPAEHERIYRCGGHVVEQPAGGISRVNGDLAVSRSFGDAEYKKTGGPSPEDRPVTANPEIGHYECGETDFLMLVCDGVSEGNFPNPEVVELAAQVLRESGDPGLASKAVIHRALECNSKDNITCMIVTFNGGEPEQSQDFIPGPLYESSHNGFITSYKAMAERAGLTLAQAAEMRYDYLEKELAEPSSPEGAGEEGGLAAIALEELKQEISNIGTPDGAKGSSAREEWFRSWAEGKPSGGRPNGQADQVEMMRMMMQRPGGADALMNMLGQQRDAHVSPGDGRKVRAASIDVLKPAVDEHSALQWDERMRALAGEEGVVQRDDAWDGTSQVRFPGIGMAAWLPTSVLENVDGT